MTSLWANDGSRDVCPSCNTRLRLSLNAKNPSLEFACPECETPLVAQWDAAAGVEVSHVVDPASVDPASGEVSAQFNASRMVRNLTAKHRTIAAVITAVFGLLLALNLTSTEDSSSPNVEPSNAEGPGDASAQLLTEPGPANKPVIEMAKSTGAAEESQPVAPSSQIAELTDNDRSGSVGHPSEISSLPPKELLAQPGRDSVKLAAGSSVEPGSNPEASVAAENSADAEKESQTEPAQKPLDPQPKGPTPKPMSVRDRLGFSIAGFRQAKPVPLRDLIRTVEQMCRVKVDTSAASSNSLSAEITLSLTDTTPADILSEAGRRTGLRVIVDESSVRMIPELD